MLCTQLHLPTGRETGQPKPSQSAYGIDTDAAMYLTLPKQAKSVRAPLEYTDGTLSEVKQFAKE